jgi:hypothetical protein
MKLLAEKLKIILDPTMKEKKNIIDYHLTLQTISDRLWDNISFVNFI